MCPAALKGTDGRASPGKRVSATGAGPVCLRPPVRSRYWLLLPPLWLPGLTSAFTPSFFQIQPFSPLACSAHYRPRTPHRVLFPFSSLSLSLASASFRSAAVIDRLARRESTDQPGLSYPPIEANRQPPPSNIEIRVLTVSRPSNRAYHGPRSHERRGAPAQIMRIPAELHHGVAVVRRDDNTGGNSKTLVIVRLTPTATRPTSRN